MSIVQKLTENIVNRDLQKEGAALLDKWQNTGLLEGLGDDVQKNNMAVLLENQAKELLREASSMAGGDVEGFAAVAFPIVRRVFGGLIANDLVSVQPMSLPSGLIFFLDFTYTDDRFTRTSPAAAGDPSVYDKNTSVYGGGRVGAEITGGVNMSGSYDQRHLGGFYDLQTGYASPTGSINTTSTGQTTIAGIADHGISAKCGDTPFGGDEVAISALTNAQKTALNWDPDVLNSNSDDDIILVIVRSSHFATKLNKDNLMACDIIENDGDPIGEDVGSRVIRRLTHMGTTPTNGRRDQVTNTSTHMSFYVQVEKGGATAADYDDNGNIVVIPLKDTFTATGEVGGITGGDPWGLELVGNSSDSEEFSASDKNFDIPEIDIKVDSVSVTAMTKKLKAKWTPELGQDLNAYHNLDAEVELTSILSEQIALEIDREILNDLVQGAKTRLYWSRNPGQFVNRESGAASTSNQAPPDFTGTVSEWYETLLETINDVSARIHRKTVRGGANFLVCSPEVASILEMTAGFRASVTVDNDGSAGAVKVGSVNKKWDVHVDPYFPRNIVLVGRKGKSFLESGYVYAPYVPLQVTPTIFGVEDFVPRKGVMTRYAKKMVRPDMYGLVVIRDLV